MMSFTGELAAMAMPVSGRALRASVGDRFQHLPNLGLGLAPQTVRSADIVSRFPSRA